MSRVCPVESGGSNGEDATKLSIPKPKDVREGAKEEPVAEDFSDNHKESERSSRFDKGKGKY